MKLTIKGILIKYIQELTDCFGDLMTVYQRTEADMVDVVLLDCKIQNIGNRILIVDTCYDDGYCVYIHRPDFISAVIE